MGRLPTVGPEAFDGDRLDRDGLWAVAFLADWCPFCHEFAPRFESLGALGGDLLVADVTDLESPLWDRFRLDIVPTVVVFRDGAAVTRADGVSMRGLGDDDLRAVRAALGPRSSVPSPPEGRARGRPRTVG